MYANVVLRRIGINIKKRCFILGIFFLFEFCIFIFQYWGSACIPYLMGFLFHLNENWLILNVYFRDTFEREIHLIENGISDNKFVRYRLPFLTTEVEKKNLIRSDLYFLSGLFWLKNRLLDPFPYYFTLMLTAKSILKWTKEIHNLHLIADDLLFGTMETQYFCSY